LILFVVAGKIAIEKLIDAEVEQESRVIFWLVSHWTRKLFFLFVCDWFVENGGDIAGFSGPVSVC
jgi:hypothetical protein